MPLYSIDSPDGKTYEIEGPAGATREQIIGQIKAQLSGVQPQIDPDIEMGKTNTPRLKKDDLAWQRQSFLKTVGETMNPMAGAEEAGKIGVGALETALSMITAVPAFIAGGFVDLADVMIGGTTDDDPTDKSVALRQYVQYEPKSEYGKKFSEIIAWPFEKLHEASRAAGDKAYENLEGQSDQVFIASAIASIIEGVPNALMMLAPIRAVKGSKSKATRSSAGRRPNRGSEQAHDLLNDHSNSVIDYVADGVPLAEAVKRTNVDLKMTNADVIGLIDETGVKPQIPATRERAIQARQSRLKDAFELDKAQTGIGKLLTPISRRLRDISPKVFGRMRDYEATWRMRLVDDAYRMAPLVDALSKLPAQSQRAVKKALLNEDFGSVKAILGKNQSHLVDTWKATADSMLAELKAVGYEKIKPVDMYFPRIIKDMKRVRRALNRKDRNALRDDLKSAEKELKRPLTPMEQSNIALTYLTKQRAPGIPASGFAKGRKVKRVSDDMLDYYMDPHAALLNHLHHHVVDVTKRQFFGRHLTKKKGRLGKQGEVDLNKSIGKLLAEDKVLQLPENMWALAEAKDILMTRFGTGEMHPSGWAQLVRNITYTGTIGNTFAGLTQVKDIGVAFHRYGFRDAMTGLLNKNKPVRAIDLGVVQAAVELLQSPKRSARYMEKFLQNSGFNWFDRFGKNTLIDAALRNTAKAAKSTKGRAEFMNKWADSMGRKEAAAVLDDIANGRYTTDRARAFLFNELSEAQPISLLEIPKSYLKHPNGRVAYTLQTFALRQLDMIRATGIKDWRAGNKVRAAKQVATTAMVLGATGVPVEIVKRWLKGQQLEPSDIPVIFFENILGLGLMSRWTTEKMLTQGPGDALWDRLAPPILDMSNAVWKDVRPIFTDHEFNAETMKYLPGPFVNAFHWWIGKGRQRELERRKSREGLYKDLELY